eukprot:SAG11_NODE_5444_length_1558_cov_1.759424_2_plen_97_part_00
MTRIPALAIEFRAARDAGSGDFRWARYCLDDALVGDLSKLARAFAVFMSERDFLLHGCVLSVSVSEVAGEEGLDFALWSLAYWDALVHLARPPRVR